MLGEYNVAGELWQVAPLFARLGIRVLAPITGDARYHQVAWRAPRPGQHGGVQPGDGLARPRHAGALGHPLSSKARSTASAIPRRACARWRGCWSSAAPPADLLARTEALIAEEEARAWAALAPYRARLAGKRVLLYTGGVKSWSVVSALQEIGMVVVGTSVRKSTDEDKERIKELMGDDAPMVDQIPAKQMYAMLAARRRRHPDVRRPHPVRRAEDARRPGSTSTRSAITATPATTA